MSAGDRPEAPPGRVLLAFVTGPDASTLSEIGRTLVQERLAACVNVWGGLSSIYRWRGAVEEESEALALFKTTERAATRLQARIRELHPYEEPEFLAVAVELGSDSYLNWVVESVRPLGPETG